jgi:CHAD domain-containing protein
VSVSSTGRFAAKYGDKLLQGVTTQIDRAMRSPGIDEMHDLRVAIRRFTRVLTVMKPCFPRAETRRIRRGMKRLKEQAGTVRDYDIAMRLLTKVEMPESVAPGPTALARQLRESREQAALTLTTSLGRWVKRDLPANWRHARKSEGQYKPEGGDKGADARFRARPIDAVAQSILPAMAKDHFRSGKEAAHENASAEDLHGFRISAKNLRYTLDFFAPLYGASLTGLLDQLKEVQALLGDINDCATVRRLLRRHKKHGIEPAMKEFLAALKKRQRQKTEQFREHYAPEFSNAAALLRWKERLRKTGVPKGGAKLVTKRAAKRSRVRRAATA